MSGLIQKIIFRRIVKSIIYQIDLIWLGNLNTHELRKEHGINIFSDKCPICKIGKDKNKECSTKCFLSTNHGCQKMYSMPTDAFDIRKVLLRQYFWQDVLSFIKSADNSLFRIKNRLELHKILIEIDKKYIMLL
jgi:hypothetical protein